MACPIQSITEQKEEEDIQTKCPGRYYRYMQLDKLLDCQTPPSLAEGRAPKHDEYLFITMHQTNELWFKQAMHELDSIKAILGNTPSDQDPLLLVVIRRLTRIQTIFKLLAEQWDMFATMTPQEFMGFRNKLTGGSGFQSLQFRLMENKLGVLEDRRVLYNKAHYKSAFTDPSQLQLLARSMEETTLFSAAQLWLEGTRGLHSGFWEEYCAKVSLWLEESMHKPAQDETNETLRNIKMDSYLRLKEAYASVLEPAQYQELVSSGARRLSHRAFQGAVLISLYRDRPEYHTQHSVLSLLTGIDTAFTHWRYKHSLMTRSMIGSRVGTGGSSGSGYLMDTALSEGYRVFSDLSSLASYLLPPEYLPEMPQ